jgi:hypothetical protein
MFAQAITVAGVDWTQVTEALWSEGFGRIGILFSQAECRDLRSMYSDSDRFRSRIDMARHQFGKGEYQYFKYPLPEIVSELREELYARLAPVATHWMEALGARARFDGELNGFLKQCHGHGQTRPTPLLLRYQAGDFNCLHQDVYGEVVFPFQVIIALSDPTREYEGGELLLVEQKPRAQSRGHAIRLEQGEAVAITTRFRPVKGARGFYRATIRHGVSTIMTGERFTLGIVFHDAK